MQAQPPHRATAKVAGLFLMGLLLGSWAGRAAVARATDPYAGLERFARTLTAIESDYVEPIDNEALVDAAIQGMVDTLDPHSRWMSATAVRDLRADAAGEVIGFGIELERHQDGWRIQKVMDASPAEREGLKVFDRLIAVDGAPIADLSRAQVDERLDGARGELAALTILREGWDSPQILSTQRDKVEEPALEVARLGSALYVRFIDFQRGSADDLKLALKEHAGVPVILDLRDNTGGLLDEAVGVTDLFLSEGPIVSVRGRKDGRDSHDATRTALDVPLVILVNGYTASASEIVSGALQEAGRAVLIGTPTYGKGSVQQLYRNPDGSALKLTVARYHLPSGAPIRPREGLVPDVEVKVRSVPPSERIAEQLDGLELSEEVRTLLQTELARMSDPPPKRKAIRWSLAPAERAEVDPYIQAGLKHLQ